MHVRLRRATAPTHRALEAGLDLLGPDLSLDRYQRVLAAFHGFYAVIERQLRRAPCARGSLDLVPEPPRTILLRRDLTALGVTETQVDRLPSCEDLPPLRSVGQIAGCVYVIEGASLGGQVIARALRERLGLDASRGSGFFVGAGPDTPRRWRGVLAWLEEVARAPCTADEIIVSACRIFAVLGRWLERTGVIQWPRGPHHLSSI